MRGGCGNATYELGPQGIPARCGGGARAPLVCCGERCGGSAPGMLACRCGTPAAERGVCCMRPLLLPLGADARLMRLDEQMVRGRSEWPRCAERPSDGVRGSLSASLLETACGTAAQSVISGPSSSEGMATGVAVCRDGGAADIEPGRTLPARECPDKEWLTVRLMRPLDRLRCVWAPTAAAAGRGSAALLCRRTCTCAADERRW